MIHEEFQELIILASINELDDFNAHKLKEHMNVCPDCGEEYRRMISLNQHIIRSRPVQQDPLLEKARRELRIKLSYTNQKSSFLENLMNYFYTNKFAFGGVGLFLMGIISGLFLSNLNFNQQLDSGYDLLDQSNVRISNINFIDTDPVDGEVSFECEAVKPVKIRGKVNDAHIQQILAHSLLNEKNDGIRLRAINTIASQSQFTKHPGIKIKSALIKTVRFDPNPGVRREALITINRLPLDQEIIDALLYVLENDNNAGNRIAAINSFDPQKMKPGALNQETLEILRQKTTNDNNEYIKLRAKTVVEEVLNNESL